MNTLKNKEKLFAQYWGQEVLIEPDYNAGFWIVDYDMFDTNVTGLTLIDAKIELKPLSSISDEDAIALAKHLGCDHASDEYYASIARRHTEQSLITAEVVDFIRSKGYAHDWNGITVEQQIEYGWIKLIEK